MISIEIRVKGDKIATNYHDDKITMGEVALVIYELERIKRELMDKEFDIDLHIERDEVEE